MKSVKMNGKLLLSPDNYIFNRITNGKILTGETKAHFKCIIQHTIYIYIYTKIQLNYLLSEKNDNKIILILFLS